MSTAPDKPIAISMGRRRERLAVAVGLLAVLLSGAYLFLVLGPRLAGHRVQVLAHRGASAYAPENTLAAFRVAVDQGADWLEFDVQQTADGHLVVFHDLRMERTSSGRGALRELSLEQVRQLDAGSWFGPEFAGEPIPTFEEVVRFAREANIRIFPEVKDPRFYPGIEERLAAALRAHEYEDRAIVQSFDPASLERLRQINPRLRLAALFTGANPIKGDAPARAEVVGPSWELVAEDRSFVVDAHAAGRQVVVWTIEGPAATREMLEARVDGIITSRPDVVRALLDAR